MVPVLADLLTLGVGIAISPIAIVAVILLATSGKGRTAGTAFVLGCYAFAVVFLGVLVVVGRTARTDEPESGAHVTVDVVEILLGVVLLVLAVRQWRRRASHDPPGWMAKLDGLTVVGAFLVGVLISGPLSPKDLPLLVAAGGRIAQADLAVGEVIAVILIFSLMGVTAVLVPWIISVIAPDSVEARLSGMRTWLTSNHAVIMTILFLILGFKLIGSGVADLVVN